jgi:hypothetical protein
LPLFLESYRFSLPVRPITRPSVYYMLIHSHQEHFSISRSVQSSYSELFVCCLAKSLIDRVKPIRVKSVDRTPLNEHSGSVDESPSPPLLQFQPHLPLYSHSLCIMNIAVCAHNSAHLSSLPSSKDKSEQSHPCVLRISNQTLSLVLALEQGHHQRFTLILSE